MYSTQVLISGVSSQAERMTPCYGARRRCGAIAFAAGKPWRRRCERRHDERRIERARLARCFAAGLAAAGSVTALAVVLEFSDT